MDTRQGSDALRQLVEESPLNIWIQAKVDFNINTAPLAPEKVADSLMKASALTNMAFHPVVIEKPLLGTIVLVKLAVNQPPRYDGYGWAGDEETTVLPLNATLKLQMCVNSCGFENENDLYLVERTRYYLLGDNGAPFSELQLIRWTSTPIERQASVDLSKVNVRPRRLDLIKRGVIPISPQPVAGNSGPLPKKQPNAGPTVAPGAGPFTYQAGMPLPAQMAGSAFSAATIRASNAASVLPQGASGAPTAMQNMGIPVNPGMPMPVLMPLKQDFYAPNMDELDVLHARDVALLRFKRNHEFCEELFSLQPIKSVVPSSTVSFSINVGNFEQKKLEYGAKIEKTRTEIEEMKRDFAAKKSAMQTAYEKLSKEVLAPLSNVNSEEELQAVSRRIESNLRVKFVPAPLYKTVENIKE